MGASWWNSRLCESPVWVFYSRKGCRRISSHSTACPWEYQGCQKIGRFCKDHYNAERTISKPGHKQKNSNRKYYMFYGPFQGCGKGWMISVMPQMILCQYILKITLCWLNSTSSVQASNVILYSWHLLETLVKDPKKLKIYWRKREIS